VIRNKKHDIEFKMSVQLHKTFFIAIVFALNTCGHRFASVQFHSFDKKKTVFEFKASLFATFIVMECVIYKQTSWLQAGLWSRSRKDFQPKESESQKI